MVPRRLQVASRTGKSVHSERSAHGPGRWRSVQGERTVRASPGSRFVHPQRTSVLVSTTVRVVRVADRQRAHLVQQARGLLADGTHDLVPGASARARCAWEQSRHGSAPSGVRRAWAGSASTCTWQDIVRQPKAGAGRRSGDAVQVGFEEAGCDGQPERCQSVSLSDSELGLRRAGGARAICRGGCVRCRPSPCGRRRHRGGPLDGGTGVRRAVRVRRRPRGWSSPGSAAARAGAHRGGPRQGRRVGRTVQPGPVRDRP